MQIVASYFRQRVDRERIPSCAQTGSQGTLVARARTYRLSRGALRRCLRETRLYGNGGTLSCFRTGKEKHSKFPDTTSIQPAGDL